MLGSRIPFLYIYVGIRALSLALLAILLAPAPALANNTPATAEPIDINTSAVENSINPRGDVDWFRFEIPSRGPTVIDVKGDDLNPAGRLEDADGALIAQADGGSALWMFSIERVLDQGTYFIRISGVDSKDEGNYSLKVTHTPESETGAPDLVVENMRTSATSLIPEQRFTLTATVRNQGDRAAAATEVNFYQSGNATINTLDSKEGDRPIGALQPGASQTRSFTVKAPIQEGNVYYGACVNTVSGEENVARHNQCSSAVRAVVNVPADAADTRAEATPVRHNSSTLALLDPEGDVDYYRIDLPSEGRTVFASSGDTDTQAELESRSGLPLDDDDDGGEGGNFRIDRILEAGTYYLRVSGSSWSTTGAYRLQVRHTPEEGYPDLVPHHPRSSNVLLSSGQPLTFQVTVRNEGTFPAAATTAHFYLSENPRISSLDDQLATIQLPAIAAEASVPVSAPLYASASQGRYYLGVCVVPPAGELDTRDNCSAGALVTVAEAEAKTHSLPLVLSAATPGRESFIRIANLSNRAGQVAITAIDDAGTASPEVILSIGALATRGFQSSDLEYGNAAKGLPEGVGAGQGDWRLELVTDVEILPLAYVRTGQGFVTSMYRLVAKTAGRHEVPTFNPGSNTNQVSRLRLINPGDAPAAVAIIGHDDAGARAPAQGAVRLTVPAAQAIALTAQELEQGAAALTGALGAGAGKWRLTVTSEPPVQVMSLLDSLPTGNLANLSDAAGPPSGIPLFLAADPSRESFARIINRSDQAGQVAIQAVDDTGKEAPEITLDLAPFATAAFNSTDLEQGNPDKGLPRGAGRGQGDWRLNLTTDLDVLPLAYIRTQDGFVTSMHAVAPLQNGLHQVFFLNPGSNYNQVGRLRLINPGEEPVEVAITGIDDNGARAPATGAVTLTLPPSGSAAFTARQLEDGAPGLTGALGDGAGKWRLTLAASRPIEVMSLLESRPTGNLANLSSGDNRRRVGDRFRDCPQCPEMVVIPPGVFRMGSPSSEEGHNAREAPLHRVTIGKPFAVGVHEATFAEWQPCRDAGVCRPSSAGGWGRGRQPAINLSWQDAHVYIGWLNETTGQAYRLLTEAEWEYAARAGSDTPFHTGQTISTDQANYNGNFIYGAGLFGVSRARPIAVGSFSANAFGLHDMHGNVAEWVQDCWQDNYQDVPADGAALAFDNCASRSVRGGHWLSAPQDVRSAFRARNPAGARNARTGFRVARPLSSD